MENKINIFELIKDCPKGMELDCTMFEKPVKYMGLTKNETYIIAIKTSCDKFFCLTKEGYLYDTPDSKCIIFPKGKTTWEGFVPPCEFKDGDILYIRTSRQWICIYKEGGEKENVYYKYAATTSSKLVHDDIPLCQREYVREIRLASEKEKQRLFDAIKANGYKWNVETKTLEKLVVPEFKVGDKVREKGDEAAAFTISDIDDSCYYCGEYVICNICDQDDYELVSDKFDITTLKPFDKVLARDTDNAMWIATLFSHLRGMVFYTVSTWYNQCIPYEGNEHLLGKTEDCDEFYKTWE